MKPKLCRAIFGKDGISYESEITTGLSLAETIQDDKKYGTFKPANGDYFTYAVLNEDEELTLKEAEQAITFAQKRWSIYAKLPKFRRVKKDYTGIIDFKIEFRTVLTDPDKQLTSSTIMYHYYPINDTKNQWRGLCVVNKAFFFTKHGNPVTGSFMASKGVTVQFPNGMYGTLDFDKIYGHELGHGLGLPHDSEAGNMMAFREDLMVEYPSMRDQARIQAKYGARLMSAWLLKRWLDFLKYASDR